MEFLGGHSIAYEVRGGKLHFPDGQIAKEHDLEKLLKNVSKDDAIGYFRLDNAQANLKAMLDDGIIENRLGAEIPDAVLKKIMGAKV